MLLASAFSRADDVTCATTSGGGCGSSLLTTNDVRRATATGGSGGSGGSGGGITQAELARALGLAQSSDAAVVTAASPKPGWPALSCEYLEEQWRRVDTNFEVQVPKYNKPKNTTGKWYNHAAHVHAHCTSGVYNVHDCTDVHVQVHVLWSPVYSKNGRNMSRLT